MYSYLYRLIQKIILKRSFNTDLIKLINSQKPEHILDIGCADSTLLENLDDKYFYHGYDFDNSFIIKSKAKYKHKENLNFHNKNVDEVDFNEFNPENSLIVLIGLFHHINDNQIYNFISKTKNFKVIGIDAVKLSHQKNITKLLMALDRGKFIREIDYYKKVLLDFDAVVAENKYLRFPYDHLVTSRNINKEIVANIFK